MLNLSFNSTRGRFQVSLLPPSAIGYWVDKLAGPCLQTLDDLGPLLSALLYLLAKVVGHVSLECLGCLFKARLLVVPAQLLLDLQLPLQLLIANLKR